MKPAQGRIERATIATGKPCQPGAPFNVLGALSLHENGRFSPIQKAGSSHEHAVGILRSFFLRLAPLHDSSSFELSSRHQKRRSRASSPANPVADVTGLFRWRRLRKSTRMT